MYSHTATSSWNTLYIHESSTASASTWSKKCVSGFHKLFISEGCWIWNLVSILHTSHNGSHQKSTTFILIQVFLWWSDMLKIQQNHYRYYSMRGTHPYKIHMRIRMH